MIENEFNPFEMPAVIFGFGDCRYWTDTGYGVDGGVYFDDLS
jgi:hypothetical protein